MFDAEKDKQNWNMENERTVFAKKLAIQYIRNESEKLNFNLSAST